MAAIPVGLAYFLLVPSAGADGSDAIRHEAAIRSDAAVQRASLIDGQVKIARGMPPLPNRSLPRAVDVRGVVHEPVIPADDEVEASAQEEGLPSPQSPRRVTDLPPLTPVPSASPEPTA